MIVKITREIQVKLLIALKKGLFNTDDFRELQEPQVQIFLPDNGRD
jgi:hypothetical protein